MRIGLRLCAVMCLLTVDGWSGAWLRNQKGLPIFWKDGKASFKIANTVHTAGGDSGVDRRESAASVHSAIWQAAQAWIRAGKGKIQIELSRTGEQTISETGNLITFTDPAVFDKGICAKDLYIACAIVSFDQDSGEILSANIAFNPYKKHSSIGLAGTHDIGLVVMHEFGHALGLDHSPVLDAVMHARSEWESPSTPLPQFAIRELTPDDAQALMVRYPSGPVSRIEGSVRRGEAPVSGAHVLALGVQGQPVAGVVSGVDGAYSLQLPPGQYRLLAEPLDGPTMASEVYSVVSPSAPFPTVYWTVAGGAADIAEPVSVAEGETRAGIDFAVTGGRVVNADTIGLIQNGAYWGTPRVHVARGRSYMLGITRTPPEGEPEVRVPAIVKLDGTASAPAAVPQLVRQKIQIPADATLGSFDIDYASNGAIAALPGAIRVVSKPEVATVSPAGGRLYLIQGTDLAGGVTRGERWNEEVPLPTQLGGTSVRVKERFAPLVAVSPGEIVFEMPEGVGEGAVEVVVVTGSGIESTSVRLE